MNSLTDIYTNYVKDPNFEHLRKEGVNLVPGRGNTKNPIAMVVGEAPGLSENRHVSPFVGQSGILLFRLMKEAGLKPENTFVTNTVKYCPLDKTNRIRTPTEKEIINSKTYIFDEWRATGGPKYVITLGNVAKMVYNIRGNITVISGKRIKVDDSLTVIPMVHPSYILRNPGVKTVNVKLWKMLSDITRD